MKSSASLLSALIYISISVIASGVFFIFTLSGDYTWVTRIGGTAWVFLLAMIVLMPTVIPRVKKRMGGK